MVHRDRQSQFLEKKIHGSRHYTLWAERREFSVEPEGTQTLNISFKEFSRDIGAISAVCTTTFQK